MLLGWPTGLGPPTGGREFRHLLRIGRIEAYHPSKILTKNWYYSKNWLGKAPLLKGPSTFCRSRIMALQKFRNLLIGVRFP